MMKKLKVTLEDRPIDVELAQYKRMFEAACSALGAIGDALGVDPNEGGAEPILKAIAQLAAAVKTNPVQVWCDTCEGSGQVYQEHQAGCNVGGHYPCPDCDGKGFNKRSDASLAAARPQGEQASKRVPLTGEQIDEIYARVSDEYDKTAKGYESHNFARAIEAAHGITKD